MDVISIFFIIYYHAFNYFKIYSPNTDILNAQITPYMVGFGLVAFAFSSGFKVFLNHEHELANGKFLSNYMKTRFIRLYKPYIAYFIAIYIMTFFMFVPLLREIYPFLGTPKMDLEKIAEFLLLGISPLTGHLWFLFIILIITLGVLGFLYIFNQRVLFYVALPSLLIYLSLNIHVLGQYSIVSEIPYYLIYYSTIFTFGAFIAHIRNKPSFFWIALPISGLFLSLYYVSGWNDGLIPYLRQIIINPLFHYGITYPVFILCLLLYFFPLSRLSMKLAALRPYTFIIYIFQYPIVIPLAAWCYARGDMPSAFAPIGITIISFISCILLYNAFEKLNIKMFR